ncbi:MAG: phosphoenolpyruvate carboxykinase (ATP), partial [Planctomycetota bacterium]
MALSLVVQHARAQRRAEQGPQAGAPQGWLFFTSLNGGLLAMPAATSHPLVGSLPAARLRKDLASAALVEEALANGEGRLASNGAFVVRTGDRTGRSPKDKFLEDAPEIHNNIWWGAVNQPMTSEQFTELEKIAHERLSQREKLYLFHGFVGADPAHRLGVATLT